MLNSHFYDLKTENCKYLYDKTSLPDRYFNIGAMVSLKFEIEVISKIEHHEQLISRD